MNLNPFERIFIETVIVELKAKIYGFTPKHTKMHADNYKICELHGLCAS